MGTDCGCGCGGKKAKTSGGCGCGGSGGSGGCGCGCGGSSLVQTGTGFVRPRFFGGMLLTEDDLQATIDYTVAKRKLTNRYVIGAGVVCGLEVKAATCDSKSVVVEPGYAIECCGNDILVSCSETVNVLDLVQDLRDRKGVDCGEGCDQQPPGEYYLYVKYVETPTSPVAPYQPDDCATGECEYSRVSEGYRFELRCDGPEDIPTLIDALRECRPKDEVLERGNRDVAEALTIAQQRDTIIKNLSSGKEAVQAAPAPAEFKKVLVDPAKPAAGVKFDEGVALVQRVLAAHADAVGNGPLVVGAVRRPVPKATLDKAKALALELKSSDAFKAQPADDQARIERLLTTAVDQPDLSTLTPIDRAWLANGTTPGGADTTFVTKAEAVRGDVLRVLADRGEAGSEDYRALSAMKFHSLSEQSSADIVRVGRAWLGIVKGCLCSAFNPPCPSCTDDAVALAKVKVEDCEVTDICELERRWVLSPRALGYWFPVVDTVRERLERLCCGERKDEPQPAPEPNEPRAETPYAVAQATGEQLAYHLKEASGDQAAQAKIASLEQQLAAVSARLDAMAAMGGKP